MSQLSAGDSKNHAVNLNFDLVGSPDFVRFVYDGDGSASPARPATSRTTGHAPSADPDVAG